MKRRRVTIKDVAQRAGVSVATVSAVLNQRQTRIPVSEKSRRAVLRAVRELHYRADPQARGLRIGRSYTVGVVVSDLTQPFSGEMLRVVEQEVTRRDYHFLVSDGQGKGGRSYSSVFQAERVEGMLFVGAGPHVCPEELRELVDSGIPVVLTELEMDAARVPAVLVDNVAGSRMATEHLLRGGYKRIICIRGPDDHPVTAQRVAGYTAAMAAAGKQRYQEVIAGGMKLADGLAAMEHLLQRRRPPEAVVCFNDALALGGMRLLHTRGVRVPEEMAVVGYDDIALAAYADPPLTTVRQPVVRMCREAVGLLLDMVDGVFPRGYYRKVMLPPELIVRRSCGVKKQATAGRDGDETGSDY